MGAIVSAPLGCLSSCAGGLLAGCCCKLATAGSTDTNKGARCVLLWLQVVAVILAALMSLNPKSWLDWPCGKLPADLGICECYGLRDENSCYTDQIIYRTEASALVIFLFLLIMCVSGCGWHAAKSFPCGKFLVLVLLILVALFLPNASMTLFGSLAGVFSSVCLVAQMLIVIDLAYTWNENWLLKSRQYLMNTPGGRNLLGRLDNGHDGVPSTPWTTALLISSGVLCIVALVLAVILCVDFKVGGAITMVCLTFVACLALFLLSLTEWCEHGNLITSAVVLLYSMWLAYEALVAMPDTTATLLPWWFSLLVCAASLSAFAFCTSSKEQAQTTGEACDIETSRKEKVEIATEDQDDAPEDLDTFGFTKQCLIHASAAVYIASVWAPTSSSGIFAARVIALGLSLAIYGWVLIAPKILTNRSFN